MKKILLILFCICLTVFSASCGENGIEIEKSETEVQTQSDTDADTAEDTQAPETEGNVESNETVVFDSEECVLKIIGVDEENVSGYALLVYAENKSDSKEYTFTTLNATVNGVQCDAVFSLTLKSGENKEEKLIFAPSPEAAKAIEQYSDIEITFYVYDSDDYMSEPVAEKTVRIYPKGQENAVKYEYQTTDSDTVVVDNDHIKVIVTGYDTDESVAYTVDVVIINKTSKDALFNVTNVSVNGLEIDPIFISEIEANCLKFDKIKWEKEDLDEFFITKIDRITFDLKITDCDDFEYETYFEGEITLNP